VYIEELRNSGFLAGRSDNNALVQVKGDESLLGQIVNVKITNPKRLALYGEVVL
nr:TRAM domain-containing protein [Campylobacteraceae bacterium]